MNLVFVLQSSIFVFGITGTLLASYIYVKKRRKQAMVCPIGSDCGSVIYSEYSHFLGLPIELLGLCYYALMSISYGAFLSTPELKTPLVALILVGISIGAFSFSLYLTFIQGAVLKKWCTWCLFSFALTTLIVCASIANSTHVLIERIEEYKRFFVALHLIGMALGLGGATISDFFFFRFLKDLRISLDEANILHMFSQVIWLGLGISFLSGIALYLPEMERLNESAKFLVKVIVVLVITLNGAFLNLKIAPQLVKISFGRPHHHSRGELHHERRLAYALGAISIISWYSAFTLGMFRISPASFLELLGIYGGLLLIGVVVSQIVERRMGKRVSTEAPTT
jgi:uncharacterized membrane protein